MFFSFFHAHLTNLLIFTWIIPICAKDVEIDNSNDHPCDRSCDGISLTCEYVFNVTLGRTMNEEKCGKCPEVVRDCYKPGCIVADGFARPLFLVNGQYPGPLVSVCENDTIKVDVHNQLVSGEAFTVHWHGIYQKGTPYMDGVSMVTQCPILPGLSFGYTFKAFPAGTKFWHAHTSTHRVDGIVGPLIIKPQATSNWETLSEYTYGDRERIPYRKIYGKNNLYYSSRYNRNIPTEDNVDNDDDIETYEAASQLEIQDPNTNFPEFIVFMQEWKQSMAPFDYIRDNEEAPSLLINGKQGVFPGAPPTFFIVHSYPKLKDRDIKSYSEKVFANYFDQLPLFRFISNGFLYCPIEYMIQDHYMVITYLDGYRVRHGPDTKLKAVDIITMFPGDRVDIRILPKRFKTAKIFKFLQRFIQFPENRSLIDDYENKTGGGYRWCGHCGKQMTSKSSYSAFELKVWSSGTCHFDSLQANASAYIIFEHSKRHPLTDEGAIKLIETELFKKAESMSQESTHGNEKEEEENSMNHIKHENLTIANPVHFKDLEKSSRYIKVTDFQSINNESWISQPPDHRIFLFTDSFLLNEDIPMFNNISFKHPSAPILSQPRDVKRNELCTLESRPQCSHKFCQCTHLYPIKLNSIVEIMVVDEGLNGEYDIHSVHLHGHSFKVIAQEKIADNITLAEVVDRDRRGLIKRNFDAPVTKDAVAMPEGGYVLLKFRADNPGYWMFHCHLEFHFIKGMALIFKVGEAGDLPPVPRRFPKCGNWP